MNEKLPVKVFTGNSNLNECYCYSRFIEIKNLKTIRVGQKTQKYRKNRTPILPPEITILKNQAQC
ncbi:MAG: hypothetical protein WBG28_04935, partial [Desulfobulbales bacterium]